MEWTVRAVYTAYLGWFDGNPTHLHPLSPKARADKRTVLMGGRTEVLNAARKACQEMEYQWCLELCDQLLDSDGDEMCIRDRDNEIQAHLPYMEKNYVVNI